jgi:ribosomal protein S1
VFQDINGLVHLSELSQKSIQNPNEVVKLGQMIKTKIILLDPKNRKIGLSMKGMGDDKNIEEKIEKKITHQTQPVVASKLIEDTVIESNVSVVDDIEVNPVKKFEGKGLA